MPCGRGGRELRVGRIWDARVGVGAFTGVGPETGEVVGAADAVGMPPG